MSETTGIILPPGVERAAPQPRLESTNGVLVNQSGLPDQVVSTYLEEQAGFFGIANTGSFRRYQQTGGSLLARGSFEMPQNISEEIMLARDLAERDDDVKPTIGAMISMAFGERGRNTHEDEVVAALYDECDKNADLLMHVCEEMYREWLIAAQFTSLTVFSREQFSFKPAGADRARSRSVVAPRTGIIAAEQIIPMGNDIMGTAPLYYRPTTSEQEQWLREYFNEGTSAGRKREMQQENRLLVTMLLAERRIDWRINAIYTADNPDPPSGEYVYLLNPRLVHRTTAPKGQWPHPRPFMTANFGLLEAKRLLGLMDYALLEGASNYLVIAKKGSDQKPADQIEVDALHETLKRASKTGLIIGDHRLDIEIVTPKLDELLNPSKRRLVGRSLARTMLRLPDFNEDGQAEEVKADVEILTRVITHDRNKIVGHIERHIYEQIKQRNENVDDAAKIWFPKIILQGAQFFTDMVLKMRDRGDISRRSAVEAGGWDYTAEVGQRKREKPDDLVMSPPAVPFDSPNRPGQAGAPNDNGPGRPRGSTNGGQTGEPGRAIARRAEVVAVVEEPGVGVVRIGQSTSRMLDDFPEHSVGRLGRRERKALRRVTEETAAFTDGALVIVPVNHDYEVGSLSAVRLNSSLTAVLGRRQSDDALVTRALIGRSPDLDVLDVEELALRIFGAELDDPDDE